MTGAEKEFVLDNDDHKNDLDSSVLFKTKARPRCSRLIQKRIALQDKTAAGLDMVKVSKQLRLHKYGAP